MKDKNTEDKRSTENQTAAELIPGHLETEGRSTVHELATELEYTHSHIRRVAKTLREENVISGEKTKGIIGCRVNGMWIILTSNRKAMLQQLRNCAPNAAAEATSMSVDELHDHIKQVAEIVAQIANRWEFWTESDQAAESETTEAESEMEA